LKVGNCSVSLVTNVLDQRKLSDRMAIQLYRKRWGVELQFRTIKQTFKRRELRSRNPSRALVELDWSLVGLWLIQLFAVKSQIEIGEHPENCSVSLAITIIRNTFQRWAERPDQTTTLQLATAVKDKYKRTGDKQGRYRPNIKDKPSAGHPKIKNATRAHKIL